MNFTKMQGTGNDYIYVNCFEETVEDPAALAVKLSDRHFGIGGDGLILICPSDVADFKMRMFNADGSEGRMCGNGTRCIGKYVYDRRLTGKTELTLETLSGIKTLCLSVEDGTVKTVRVDMGAPVLRAADIPVICDTPEFVDQSVTAGDKTYRMTCVSMGNPHAVTFVEDVASLELPRIGPPLENHPMFPQRANIEFVQPVDNQTLKMRVWERGSGETLACGTGACASLVAAVFNGKCRRRARVILLGGELDIEWNEQSGRVYLTGPAEFVFDGEI
ncbi:diaminopimelate epimerase [Sporobacter termitidis DSM 10068]|uniref:Diaminopimelate epimerase n=1 Tax=Sporobacter termitidis DSM 10068 TaxID=1123282 RepID=A0A1M5TSZ2_9FIRM|nr:diaminopimelate epimerase [Sporobacter termitidis]SHH53935.1 diaminopimelate epimerase [Sporobacter termitidis DSM 10068]